MAKHLQLVVFQSKMDMNVGLHQWSQKLLKKKSRDTTAKAGTRIAAEDEQLTSNYTGLSLKNLRDVKNTYLFAIKFVAMILQIWN